MAFPSPFLNTSARGSDFCTGLQDPSEDQMLTEGHGCGYLVLSSMLGALPLFTHSQEKASKLCSAALVDLSFSLPAAAVFRSELL